MQETKEKHVICAAHGDGTGSFIMTEALVRAMALRMTRQGKAVHFSVLNSSEPFATQKLQAIVEETNVKIDYFKVDNLCRIPKTPTGEVDVTEVTKLVENLDGSFQNWPGNVDLKFEEADLIISFGVPWAHEKALKAKVPSIEYGDMLWSAVYHGICPKPHSLKIEKVLNELHRLELLAKECYFVPWMAPALEYEKHMDPVPVNWTRPGGSWTGDQAPADPKKWLYTVDVAKALRNDLRAFQKHPSAKIVVISAGQTGVWDSIMSNIATNIQVPKSLAIVRAEKSEVNLLEKSGGKLEETSECLNTLGKMKFSRAFYAAADLGLTRSAGGVLGFVSGRTPAAIAEEPGHWLGDHQRQAVLGEEVIGPCFMAHRIALPFDLESFRNDPVTVIQGLLQHPDYLPLRNDLQNIPIGVEQQLAETLINKYLS